MIGNNNLVISTWNHARSAHITREIERRNIKMVLLLDLVSIFKTRFVNN